MNKKQRTILFVSVSILITFIIWLIISGTSRRPRGNPGAEAEKLTRQIQSATGNEAFLNTAAVSFVFNERNTYHLRDRIRDLVEVRFEETGPALSEPVPVRVQYSNQSRRFMVWENEKLIHKPGRKASDRARYLFQKALEYHTNDYFWLHPFAQITNPGTVRSLAKDGSLIVTFEAGGLTPGDTYQIYTNKQGLPVKWKMWVQAVPAAGMEVSFEDWTVTDTGFKVSRMHKSFNRAMELSQIKTYKNYPADDDPFREFLGYSGRSDEKEL